LLTISLLASSICVWASFGEIPCEVELPAEIHLELKVRTTQGNKQAFAVCSGAAVTFLGNDNQIFIVKGAATITGKANTIYVREGGSVTVTGPGNRIYAHATANVVNTNPDSQQLTCSDVLFTNFDVSSCRPGDAVAKPKQKLRTSVIDWVPKRTYKLAEEAKADASDTLIGTWRVTSALFEKEEYPAVGKLIFYKEGKGYQDFQVQIKTKASFQKGSFQWHKEKGRILVENEGEKLVWEHPVDEADRQQVALTTTDGVKLMLFLARKR